MRIYYDCEFVDDGRTIDLISIAMQAEDGRRLYLIVDDEEAVTRAVAYDWLREHVIPHLPIKMDGDKWDWDPRHPDHGSIVGRGELKHLVAQFITATPDAELWAWFGAYDHVAYAQLFGRMIDLPRGFPMLTKEFQQEVDRAGGPELPPRPDVHHPLVEARWLMAAHHWLEDRQRGVTVAFREALEDAAPEEEG